MYVVILSRSQYSPPYTQVFSDIKLVCQDGEVYAHKAVLSRCDYFLALLRMQKGNQELLALYTDEGSLFIPRETEAEPATHQREEDGETEEADVLYLHNVTEDVLVLLLRALYTGRISDSFEDSNTDVLVPLLIAADEFGVEEAKEWCERTFMKIAEPEHIVDLFQLADRHNAALLRQFCAEQILTNFDEINKVTPIFYDGNRRTNLGFKKMSRSQGRDDDGMLTKELRAELRKELNEVSTKKKILLEKYDDANELYHEAQILSGRITDRREAGKALLGFSVAGLLLGVCYWLAEQ